MNLVRFIKRIISDSSTKNLSFLSESSALKFKFKENTKTKSDWEYAVPYEKVPGPKALPLFGNTWRFAPLIGDFQIEHLDQVSKKLYQEYGNIVKMDGLLGRPDMLFLFDADEIEKVFRHEDAMPLRPSMPSLNYYKHIYQKDFFGNEGGLIAVHGRNWKNFRSKVNQIMLLPRTARMYLRTIENAADAFVNRIECVKSENEEVPDDFLNEIHKWSLESIARVALDVELGCLTGNADKNTQKLIDAVNTFFLNVPILELKFPLWKIISTPTFRKYIESLDVIKDVTMSHIQKALKKLQKHGYSDEPSVLQRVLMTESDKKVACILAIDLFLVGIDTTSNAVASILYQLATHEDKQEILQEEVDKILSQSDSRLTNNNLEKMGYLKACIKETMRMYPVVIGNGRCLSRDCIIGGYHIPKGVQVIFQHCVMSNTEKYFEKCDQFLPERWLKQSRSSCGIHKDHHPFASLPFGYGTRMCLGKRFAELEIQTVIAKIIKKYKIEYHHEKLDYYIHPMYTPKGPLKLKFISRI